MALLRWTTVFILVIMLLTSCSGLQSSGLLALPNDLISNVNPNILPTPTQAPTPVPSTSTPNPPRVAALAGTIQKDVTYGAAEGVELKLDLYFPAHIGPTRLPAVLFVHGGSWVSGDKAFGFAEINELARRGYLVASVNYRLAPQWKFPAQIEDVKCAVRYLRAHAAEYQLDPARIGAYGTSAGGHLVALLGATDSSAGLEGSGGYPEYSSRVAAVVDSYGPTDFSLYGAALHPRNKEVFGAKSLEDPIIARASPTTYVTSDDPPFLILHGDKDQMVKLQHSEVLMEKLHKAGVPARLVVVKNAGHGFSQAEGDISPSFSEVLVLIGNFFDENLK